MLVTNGYLDGTFEFPTRGVVGYEQEEKQCMEKARSYLDKVSVRGTMKKEVSGPLCIVVSTNTRKEKYHWITLASLLYSSENSKKSKFGNVNPPIIVHSRHRQDSADALDINHWCDLHDMRCIATGSKGQPQPKQKWRAYKKVHYFEAFNSCIEFGKQNKIDLKYTLLFEDDVLVSSHLFYHLSAHILPFLQKLQNNQSPHVNWTHVTLFHSENPFPKKTIKDPISYVKKTCLCKSKNINGFRASPNLHFYYLKQCIGNLLFYVGAQAAAKTCLRTTAVKQIKNSNIHFFGLSNNDNNGINSRNKLQVIRDWTKRPVLRWTLFHLCWSIITIVLVLNIPKQIWSISVFGKPGGMTKNTRDFPWSLAYILNNEAYGTLRNITLERERVLDDVDVVIPQIGNDLVPGYHHFHFLSYTYFPSLVQHLGRISSNPHKNNPLFSVSATFTDYDFCPGLGHFLKPF
ncbi:hypothetical protein RFI_24283 [Reticulomyxa filosa]|uniref:Uncharacterized protein n=1 Tax=Reticulomyxa filosa TaxID=46433 RepID=X6MHE0_RETFI|nr:hypothetical protein RFI_24283 [Reticulomyxa filosa]|eukprot:ETO13091.1 hypothetical protein RFI_24283 [Reticulomyxa filosa]